MKRDLLEEAINEKTMSFAIICRQGTTTYQINRRGAGPLGGVDIVTGLVTKPRTWKTRQGANAYAAGIRGARWDAVLVVETRA
ncbi:MAG: hypothetical protein ABIK12_06420 [Pseudomonadota bacterium]